MPTLKQRIDEETERLRPLVRAEVAEVEEHTVTKQLEIWQRQLDGVPLTYMGRNLFPVIDGTRGQVGRIVLREYPVVWVGDDLRCVFGDKKTLAPIATCDKEGHGDYVHVTVFPSAELTRYSEVPKDQLLVEQVARAFATHGNMCPKCFLEKERMLCPTCGRSLLDPAA